MARFIRDFFSSSPFVPVVRLEGMIQAGRSIIAQPRTLNLRNVSKTLDRAFNIPKARAVAVIINSPGGSAAQSHLIAERLIHLSKEKKKPVYAFVEDAAASGGYMIALGAEEIYANPFSIVGSIGVIAASFGFVDVMEKIGVERRVKTAGKLKLPTDPFSKETEEGKRIIDDLLKTTHTEFKKFVRERRGSKITDKSDELLFEGEFWLAQKALDLGLIDGIGDTREILKQKFGKDVQIRPIVDRISIFSPESMDALIPDFSQAITAKTLWGRLGL